MKLAVVAEETFAQYSVTGQTVELGRVEQVATFEKIVDLVVQD